MYETEIYDYGVIVTVEHWKLLESAGPFTNPPPAGLLLGTRRMRAHIVMITCVRAVMVARNIQTFGQASSPGRLGGTLVRMQGLLELALLCLLVLKRWHWHWK